VCIRGSGEDEHGADQAKCFMPFPRALTSLRLDRTSHHEMAKQLKEKPMPESKSVIAAAVIVACSLSSPTLLKRLPASPGKW